MSTGRLGAGDTAIQPTIFDAKGDLLTATAADTPARLAVGNSGETLVADSSASTGLRWQGNFAAGKNKIINGDFNIWQRGTSSTSNGYLADRFSASASGGTNTISRQSFTAGTAPVAGYEAQYFHRIATSASATYFDIYQPIEDVRTFAGQTVTFSFWAKASSSVGVLPLLRQNFGSGGSANVDNTGSTMTFTTSWVRYSFTTTLGSMSGKTIGTGSYLGAFFYYTSGTATSNNIDTWGWQVEAGNVATAFQTATGTLGGELAACQRYYWRQTGDTTNAPYGTAINVSGNSHSVLVQYPVPMRVTPTAIEFSTLAITDKIAGTWSITALTIDTASSSKFATFLTATAVSGLASRSMCFIVNNSSTAGYLGFTAEL